MSTVATTSNSYLCTAIRNGFTEVRQRVPNLAGWSASVENLTDVKLVKFLISGLELGSKVCGSMFHTLIKVLKEVKDVFYAIKPFESAKELTKLHQEKDKVVRFCNFLNYTSSIFDLGKFLQKYGIAKLEVFSRISSAMTSWTVSANFQGSTYEIRPFTIKPLSFLANSPKDLFILTSSVVSVAWSIAQGIAPKYFAGKKESEVANFRLKLLDGDKIIKHLGNIGKIVLILKGDVYGNTVAFKVIDCVTQFFGLIGSSYFKPVKAA